MKKLFLSALFVLPLIAPAAQAGPGSCAGYSSLWNFGGSFYFGWVPNHYYHNGPLYNYGPYPTTTAYQYLPITVVNDCGKCKHKHSSKHKGHCVGDSCEGGYPIGDEGCTTGVDMSGGMIGGTLGSSSPVSVPYGTAGAGYPQAGYPWGGYPQAGYPSYGVSPAGFQTFGTGGFAPGR